MECEFKYEKGNYNKWAVSVAVTLLSSPIITRILANCFPTDVSDIILPLYILFILIFTLVYLFYLFIHSFDGYILCLPNQNCIAVCRGRRQRIIPIEGIESVSCLPEVTHTRYSVKHMLVFTVILKTGKKLAFCTELDIDKDMPVRQPEKFKEYIAKQPMTELYEYINKCLGAE